MRFKNIFAITILTFCHVLLASDSTLIVGIPNKLANLHPFEATTAQQSFILPLLYESLLVTEINGDTRPNLIKEWHIDEKEKSLTFKIRDGVLFSDNSLLKLQDVVESFRLICQHPIKSQELSIINGCSPYNGKRFGVVVVGDSVKISITRHPSFLLSKLAGENVLILKKKNDKFLGTGPLKIKELNDKELILDRNLLHNFWRKGSKFSEVHFRFIDEHNVKDQIDNNRIHIASMYLTSTALSIHNQKYFTVNHAPNVVQALVLNTEVYPFNNFQLRKSIHSEITKTSFIECNPGSRKTNGFIPKGIGGSLDPNESNIEFVPFDKVKLKKLILIKLHRHIGRKNLCEERKLRDLFTKFNIDLEVIYHEDYDTLDKAVLDQKVAGFLELYVFKSRDASTHLKNMVPENKKNFYKISSSEIRRILEQAWNAKDLRSRFSFYKQINKIIYQNSSLIDLYAIGHTNLIHKCLLKQEDNVSYYNPNSFLFLLKLDFKSECQLEKKL